MPSKGYDPSAWSPAVCTIVNIDRHWHCVFCRRLAAA
jgi:hypothetical protein